MSIISPGTLHCTVSQYLRGYTVVDHINISLTLYFSSEGNPYQYRYLLSEGDGITFAIFSGIYIRIDGDPDYYE